MMWPRFRSGSVLYEEYQYVHKKLIRHNTLNSDVFKIYIICVGRNLQYYLKLIYVHNCIYQTSTFFFRKVAYRSKKRRKRYKTLVPLVMLWL